MNILVIGSGGREHAICWKLQQSAKVSNVYVLPGSDAIAALPKTSCVKQLNVKDFKAIVAWCVNNAIDLVAIGPEDPLADGLADELTSAGIKCFGPSKNGARIEADKNWSKDFMIRHSIPTARYQSFQDADEAKKFIKSASFDALVVKASGLAAGKGVIVAQDRDEACRAVDEILGEMKFGRAGEIVVVEELLTGEEVSCLAFVDSDTVKMLLPAQDHKRLMNNDEGLNTGGMGAYCPCKLIDESQLEMVKREVLQRAVDGLRSEGIRYNGILYAGMMLTSDGPKTLEFNCRFGDPETQVILPLLKTDLVDLMLAACENRLKEIGEIEFEKKFAVGVVMASAGYPETSTKGCVITNLDKFADRKNLIVFHSGTAKNGNGEWITNGGRVLINVAIDENLRIAAGTATDACDVVQFQGEQHRTDIAHKSFRRFSVSYKDCGVDMVAGGSLVERIKLLASGTRRAGVINEVGSFDGLLRLNDIKYVDKNGQEVNYKDPVLVQGTDGVGTKLKIAKVMNVWDTIGIDLVAMCANDVLCNGAEPVAFLDYIACGKLDVATAALIVKGVTDGCRRATSALLGGEVAEMPDVYEVGDYDLAGYSLGIVEHDRILPRMDEIREGDIVVGLPSSGIHSNGFSLVNRILEKTKTSLNDVAPFSHDKKSFGRELLTPTRIYTDEIMPLLRKGNVRALAHITGGGLIENIPRVFPKESNLGVSLDANSWKLPEVFGWIAGKGNVVEHEMLRTLNCGIGMVIILPKDNTDWKSISDAKLIGSVVMRGPDEPKVQVKNFTSILKKISDPWRDAATTQSTSYKESGVDITAGDSLVDNIKPLAKATVRDGVLGSIGSFGGMFRLKDLKKKYADPLLVMRCNGVGTKLKIAHFLNQHKTIGIDLVAMCFNDIICNGAEPLTFLDYYACGKLDVKTATSVVAGISNGCIRSGAALLGGETAEMPGMYQAGEYDMAGFALGITEYCEVLPKKKTINLGDVVIGLPSSGLHSDGFSLARKVIEIQGFKLDDVAPFSAEKKTFAEELLTPTRIYVNDVMPAVKTGRVKAIAHISSGGLWENIPKVLPKELTAELEAKFINIQPVFGWLTAVGQVEKLELMKTFNCGIGMILITSPENQLNVMTALHGTGAAVVGKIIKTKPNGHQLIIRNFATCVERIEKMVLNPQLKKRVAVLISGSGTNLQALINATKDTKMGMNCEIVHVISNKAGVFGLERATNAGISSTYIGHRDFPTRENFDDAMHKVLIEHQVDIVCLAGFMRIVGAEFVKKWKGRLINIHPSLLPKFKGIKAQQEALESGDKESGCTVHFVDENVDTGATIVQEIVPILPNDTVDSLTQRIHKCEYIAFPKALRLVASGYVKLNENGQTEWI